MRKLLMVVLTAMVLLPAPVRAGSYGTELPFAAGNGARASALGLAATSLTGDPSLQYFNPASLAALQYKEFEFYRTTYFDSKSAYHTFQYAHPMLNYGTLGLSVLRLDVGDIEERDIYNNLLSNDLKNAQTRLLLGYAVSLHSALSTGLNLKIDNQSFAGYSGSGVGLDLGFMATKWFAGDSRIEFLRAGFSILNLIEPSVKLDQDDVADPMSVAFGVSGAASLGQIGFVTTADLMAPRFSPVRFRFGQEISYLQILAFRFGFDGSTPTVGLGGSWRNFAVDYAYRNEDLGSNHRISLSVRFGANLKERKEAERAALEAELDRQINSKMSELESLQLAQTLERADKLFAQARYVEAAGRYEMALMWDAGNERAKSQIDMCRYYSEIEEATALIESGNHLEALYHLRRSLGYSPGDPEASRLIAECNRRIREQEDHTDMIDRMLKRSIDLYASRKFVEAQAGFREVLRLDPENRLAAEYEQKAHANITNQLHKLILEANNLADRGEYASALSTLEHVLRLSPDDEDVAARIEELRAKQREERRQGERVSKAPAPSRPPVTRQPRRSVDTSVLDSKYKDGLRSFDKGDFDVAVRQFQQVWAVAPDYHNVTELLTKAYLFMGMKKYSEEDYPGAIAIWEKVLTIDPDNSKARRYLLKAKEEMGRLSNVDNE